MFIKSSIKCVLLTLIVFVSCAPLLIAQDLIISPSPLYMGKIPIGSTADRDITIFNTTITQVNVNSVSISGSDAARFEIINNPGSFTLNALEKKEITIRYIPTSAKIDNAQFNIESSSGSFNVSIEGYGIPSFGGIQAFERILGTNEPDYGAKVKHTSDGGFIIVGSTTPPNENYASFYLVKTDVNGKVEWTTQYGNNNGPDNATDVEQTSDGGYLVLGTTDNYGAGGTDMMLVKFNGSGEFQWRKTYGSQNNDGGSAMVETLDGGFALVGQTVPSSGIGKAIYLVKVNSDGTEQWSNTYGGSSGADASDIIQLSDGSFLMAGFITINNDFQVYVVKTSSSGNLTWEKNYGGAEFDYSFSIQELSDGNFIVAGYTASKGAGARDGYLIKLSSDGNIIWDKAYGSELSDEFKSVIETGDGNIIAVGTSITRVTSTDQFTDAFMVKTDSDGNQLWSHLFGENLDDSFSSIENTNDGGYIIIGSSASYSKSSDIFLVKTGESGIVSSVDNPQNSDLPNRIKLSQNYPNPFNPSTTINFSIATTQHIKLKIYDMLGREIKTLLDEQKNPGEYKVAFNAEGLNSGVYFYQLISPVNIVTKKMLFIK